MAYMHHLIMKSFVFLIMFMCVSSNAITVHQLHAYPGLLGGVSQALLSSKMEEASAVFANQRERRQSSSPNIMPTFSDLTLQDISNCTSLISDYQCGSSGFAQRIADIALSCGNGSFARMTSNLCARSEGGDFCGSAFVQFLDENPVTDGSSCSGAVASNVCPSSCRTYLQTWRNRLGCCINTYVNNTDFPVFVLFSDFVDYRLWDMCGVPLPAADCGNGLPLDTSVSTENCTSQELTSRLAQYQCTASVGQPLVDTILQNSRCYPYARIQIDICGSNTDGQLCAELIGTAGTELNLQTNPLVAFLTSVNCDSTSGCSSSCHDNINAVNSAFGCCVNVFNSSAFGPLFPSLSYDVWSSCGIDTPGFCDSPLSDTPSMTAMPTTGTMPSNQGGDPTLNTGTMTSTGNQGGDPITRDTMPGGDPGDDNSTDSNSGSISQHLGAFAWMISTVMNMVAAMQLN